MNIQNYFVHFFYLFTDLEHWVFVNTEKLAVFAKLNYKNLYTNSDFCHIYWYDK